MPAVVLTWLAVGEDLDHHPEQVRDRCAALHQPLPEPRGGEALADDERRSAAERVERGVQRVCVEERERRMKHVVLGDSEELRHVHAPPEALRVRRSEEHTSELQSRENLVCRLLLEKKKKKTNTIHSIEKKKTKNNIQ